MIPPFSHWTVNQKLGALLLALGAVALVIGNPAGGSAVRLDTKELARIVERETDHVGVDELADWIIRGRSDYRLIDLRAEGDYRQYHIPGAENIPLTSLEEYGLPRNEKVVLYSEGGIHSAQAWFLLRARDYRGVYILRGGLEEWKDRILFPQLPGSATPDQTADFEKRKEVSKFFGGTPQKATAGQENQGMTMALPKLQMPVAPPATGTPGKKKKEGC